MFALHKEKSYRELMSELDKSTLSVYLKEINQVPLLTREEETELGRAAKNGSREAKERLVKANLRFVVNVAKQYQNRGMSLSDLISEGNIGLMSAAERFDVDRGFHFISYGVWWIRQAIMKALGEKSRMIRLPLNRANELMKIEKAQKKIEDEKNSEADIDELSEYLSMDRERIMDLLNASRDPASLDSPLSSDEDASTISDLMEDEQSESPEQMAINQDLQGSIVRVLNTLSEKEASVLRYRFGLEGERPHSLKEIGDKYNLTKERIRQIEKQALIKLRHPSRSSLLQSFVSE
jgi:RNA polymerase primary sigma factor